MKWTILNLLEKFDLWNLEVISETVIYLPNYKIYLISDSYNVAISYLTACRDVIWLNKWIRYLYLDGRDGVKTMILENSQLVGDLSVINPHSRREPPKIEEISNENFNYILLCLKWNLDSFEELKPKLLKYQLPLPKISIDDSIIQKYHHDFKDMSLTHLFLTKNFQLDQADEPFANLLSSLVTIEAPKGKINCQGFTGILFPYLGNLGFKNIQTDDDALTTKFWSVLARDCRNVTDVKTSDDAEINLTRDFTDEIFTKKPTKGLWFAVTSLKSWLKVDKLLFSLDHVKAVIHLPINLFQKNLSSQSPAKGRMATVLLVVNCGITDACSKSTDACSKSTWFCNFQDDGFKIVKNKRVNHNWKERRNFLVNAYLKKSINKDFSLLQQLSPEQKEWSFEQFNKNLKPVAVSEVEKAYIQMESYRNIQKISWKTPWKTTYQMFPIIKLFEIIKPKRLTIKYAEDNPGPYPLVSSSGNFNGISAFSNKFTYEAKSEVITLATGGTVGSAFVQVGKFGTTNHIIILKPLVEMDTKALIYVCCALKEASKNYHFAREWAYKHLKDSQILLPILTGTNKIDFEKMSDY